MSEYSTLSIPILIIWCNIVMTLNSYIGWLDSKKENAEVLKQQMPALIIRLQKENIIQIQQLMEEANHMWIIYKHELIRVKCYQKLLLFAETIIICYYFGLFFCVKYYFLLFENTLIIFCLFVCTLLFLLFLLLLLFQWFVYIFWCFITSITSIILFYSTQIKK